MDMPRLYVGPMSKNIVDAALGMPVGFCASRRQIEYNGGYVNNWTTSEFARYIDKRNLICRDHGGKFQGAIDDDGFESLAIDTKYMDIIHIDPWKTDNFMTNMEYTIDAIIKCYNLNPSCRYEIGTEQSIRFFTPQSLEVLLFFLKKRLENIFDKIEYAVIQSGTSLKEDQNTGKYDKERLEDMVHICQSYNVKSKEHNGDFLDPEIIKEKFQIGLNAINIAPEYGHIESQIIIDHIKNDAKALSTFFEICKDSKRWHKWVSKTFDPDASAKNRILTMKIAGHYILSTKKFADMKEKYRLYELDDIIKTTIKRKISEIV